jgi:hypothetical protein
MTNDNKTESSELEALERLLASHGADRTRWPAPARLRFAPLLAARGDARRLVAEAAALDRLLDLAPAPATNRGALADRIVAAASADAGQRQVIRLPERGRLGSLFGSAAARAGAFGGASLRSGLRSGPWAGGALLAASLVLGAFMGTSGAIDSAIRPLTVAAIGDTDTDADASQVAMGVDGVGPYEEELL